MTIEERKIALYCLKASSDYHLEVCEECINYPNCDHTIQDDVTETIIKALEQEPCEDAISRQAVIEYMKASDAELGHSSEKEIVVEDILNMPPVTPTKCIATEMLRDWQKEEKAIPLDKVKQARAEIEDKIYNYPDRNISEYEDCLAILDKLIESEDKE